MTLSLPHLINGYDDLILGYFVVACLVYLLKLSLATLEVIKRQRQRVYAGLNDIFSSPLTPPISVLCPAHNERVGIVQSVRALCNLRYPRYEVIVVNDGSTDDTLATLQRAFALERLDVAYRPTVPSALVRAVYRSAEYPFLTVVDKENGGKADALNCGINLARSPLFCSVDADSVLDPEALLRAAKPFIEQPERVVAAGGIIGVANAARVEGGSVTAVRLSRRPLVTFQVIEYLRSYLMGMVSGSRTNNLMIVSGAFAIYRRDLVQQIGGYRAGVVGEDAELTTHLHCSLRERGLPYSVVAVPELVCWTEVPENVRMLARQRRRWHHGLAETLFSYHRLLFNARYGALGMTGYPYLFFIELLAPVVEVSGYLVLLLSFALGLVNGGMLLLLMAVAIGYGIFLSLGTLLLEELGFRYYPRGRDMLRLGFFAILENAGYRQMTVCWRLLGLWDALHGTHSWGAMERRGLGDAPDGEQAA